MQSTKTKHVLFLGEQDGVGERELKMKLSECLSGNSDVESAYLARVSFAEAPSPQVTLCVRGGELKASTLVECVGKAFSRLFRTTQHLDILFLTDAQVEDVSRVAKPFYSLANRTQIH